MEFSHVPVLYDECMRALAIKPDGIYVDGTMGGGGHSSGICERLGEGGLFIGIDRDIDAINAASKRLNDQGTPCEKRFVQSNYADIKQVLEREGIGSIDGALLDLGVSSFQLDNPERGFSYMSDAPLDMRMDAGSDFTAYDVVNGYSEKELFRIIKDYGEERWAKRIAEFIVSARKEKKIESTFELVDIIKAAIPAAARREGPHPAKRTFQAIRIEVNDELGALEKAVSDFIDVLAPKGRLAIISFHSLEDRIVKDTFKARLNPCICPPEFPVCTCGRKPDVNKITGRPIIPTDLEIENNPRSRSAKLRILEKK